eukprot:TRINITY_DN5934_c0_g1_i1.p2 TRINITY_DN5934_c0_g1~~TRINITY_DN5934_c0_g1_i1.p2  ORF type:complete len:118 (-),score=0.81 TRINITY_DN5934_c0_g1_i1:24-377(-)
MIMVIENETEKVVTTETVMILKGTEAVVEKEDHIDREDTLILEVGVDQKIDIKIKGGDILYPGHDQGLQIETDVDPQTIDRNLLHLRIGREIGQNLDLQEVLQDDQKGHQVKRWKED